jgi:hypothetical protein
MTRRQVLVAFALAELWQLFAAGFSSLQMGAPGVGDRASWVPGFLVVQTYSLLPVGFILCLWGSPVGRILAAACGVASLAMAVVAVVLLSSPASSFAYGLVLLAPPGMALIMCAWRHRPETTARPEHEKPA